MVRDFDKKFADLIDDSIPKVMLDSKESRDYQRKNTDTKESNNEFVKNYCAEY